MAVTVHVRSLNPGVADEQVAIEQAAGWTVGANGTLDCVDDSDTLVVTFAAGNWLYAERGL